AEEAMTFYTSIIAGSASTNTVTYRKNGPGEEGTVMQATFKLKGQEYRCIDSHVTHQLTFTPSTSIYVTLDPEQAIQQLYNHLLESGQALMSLDDYGFSKKFGWVNDRFGVSWQLDLQE